MELGGYGDLEVYQGIQCEDEDGEEEVGGGRGEICGGGGKEGGLGEMVRWEMIHDLWERDISIVCFATEICQRIGWIGAFVRYILCANVLAILLGLKVFTQVDWVSEKSLEWMMASVMLKGCVQRLVILLSVLRGSFCLRHKVDRFGGIIVLLDQ